MDTKLLRQKILDLAIHGKLVPQDPNDEPASVLLERIMAEKERLIKEGKIKAPKKSKSSDTSHYEKIEGPFEIPESWEWCLVDDFAYVATGSTPSKDSFVENGIPYIKMYNLRNQKIDFSFHPQYIKEDVHKGKLKRSRTEVGDLIMNIVGPPLGKLAFIPPSLPESNFNQAAVLLRPLLHKEIINRWLFFYLSEMSEINSISTKGSAGQVNISLTQSQNMRIPMPPLAEQIRICSEIEKLWQYLDCIDTSSVVLGDTIENVKSKILNLAIQGKLVPQDPSDEPAIELLKRINPDFKPCDNSHYENLLPDGWCLAHLGDIAEYGDTTNGDVASISPDSWILELEDIEKDSAKILYMKTKAERDINGVRHSFKAGQILYSKLRTYLNKVLIAPKDGFCTTEIVPITAGAAIIPEYLLIVLRSPYFLDYTESCGYGVKMPRLGTSDAKKAIIPIPPIEEQRRIVKKAAELMTTLSSLTEELL